MHRNLKNELKAIEEFLSVEINVYPDNCRSYVLVEYLQMQQLNELENQLRNLALLIYKEKYTSVYLPSLDRLISSKCQLFEEIESKKLL